MTSYIYHYDSPLGPMTMASDGAALTGLWFDRQQYFGSTLDADTEEKKLPVFEETVRWLDEYFGGRAPAFTPPLALCGTDFRLAVWEVLREVPYGETVSYGELAARAAASRGGKAPSARAVGGAVGHNPVALIVPCHRVIGADGRLTGYAAGLDRKEALLRLEQGLR